jgi:hypothetical protein
MEIWKELLAPAIALLAAAIAFGQSYTARSRLILDLFNQRMGAYRAIRQAVAAVLTSGRATGHDDRLR